MITLHLKFGEKSPAFCALTSLNPVIEQKCRTPDNLEIFLGLKYSSSFLPIALIQ